MKTVTVYEAKAQLSALIHEVESGEEVTITRHGKPVARLSMAARPRRPREPGAWRAWPGWEDFTYDPTVFAPMTKEEMKAEGWPE